MEMLPSSLLQPVNPQLLPPALGIPPTPSHPPPHPLTSLTIEVGVGVGVEVGGPVVTMLSHALVIDTVKLVLSSLGRCRARLAAVRVISSLTEWPQVQG